MAGVSGPLVVCGALVLVSQLAQHPRPVTSGLRGRDRLLRLTPLLHSQVRTVRLG
jgi:hypothetical protein